MDTNFNSVTKGLMSFHFCLCKHQSHGYANRKWFYLVYGEDWRFWLSRISNVWSEIRWHLALYVISNYKVNSEKCTDGKDGNFSRSPSFHFLSPNSMNSLSLGIVPMLYWELMRKLLFYIWHFPLYKCIVWLFKKYTFIFLIMVYICV